MAHWAPARAWACRANRCPWAGEFSTQGQGQRLERKKKESTHKKSWAMGTYGRAGRPDNHGSNMQISAELYRMQATYHDGFGFWFELRP